MPSNATSQGTKPWSFVALNIIIKRWLAANPMKYAWGDASLPHHLFPASLSLSSERELGEGSFQGPPSTAGQTGATPSHGALGSVIGAGNLCPWEDASEEKRKHDLSHGGGALTALCFTVLCQEGLRINFTSAIITHVVVMGKTWNRTGKSNEHPKAQPCILHLGAGSVLEPGAAQGSVGHSGLALVSVQAKDRPPLF